MIYCPVQYGANWRYGLTYSFFDKEVVDKNFSSHIAGEACALSVTKSAFHQSFILHSKIAPSHIRGDELIPNPLATTAVKKTKSVESA